MKTDGLERENRQIRALGKDLMVSAIGLGCMGMSHTYGKPADNPHDMLVKTKERSRPRISDLILQK